MAFESAEAARVFIGHLSASAYARTASIAHKMSPVDVTTLEVTGNARVYIPSMHTSTFQIAGPLDVDATANGQADTFGDLMVSTAATPITYGPYGLSVSDAAVWMVQAFETDFGTETTLTGSVDWSAAAQITTRTDLNGVVLEAATAVTVDGNGTARDGGAATTNGGVAHLHVTAFSGLTNNIVTIEHSVDGSTSWATLVTFATYTAVGSERVEVAAGTTVRRHLRVVDNVTGTGSTTRAVAFARR